MITLKNVTLRRGAKVLLDNTSVVQVSHDRALLRAVCGAFWLVSCDGV